MIKYTIILFLIPFIGTSQSLKNLAEPFTKYRVSTTHCTRLVHPTGTIIFIPDHAFAVNTEEVDSVDILYREMRTPVDMIVNDIKMVTELMGKKYNLESNGMFEIYSKNENDTVDVHEDRSIIVRLAMQEDDIDLLMEAFRYNKELEIWESYNKVSSVFINDSDDDLWGSSPVSVGEFVEGNEVIGVLANSNPYVKTAFQEMEIFDFGLYNYDNIIQGEIPIPIDPTFVDTKNNELETTVYVVYDDINSVFYFDSYNWDTEFFLYKDKSYNLFTINKTGTIFKLNNTPAITGESGQQVKFTLVNEGRLPETKHELSKLTGIR